MLSRAITPKRRGRRPLAALAVITVITGLMVSAGTALAVHDLKFQLDGNTITGHTDEVVPDPAVQVKDWNSFFDANGANIANAFDPNGGNGSFLTGALTRDFSTKATKNGDCSLSGTGTIFCTVDASTFATGSKDTLDVPGWQCNKDNNVNSKIDIMNAYAAQYQDVNGDRIMYFGMEKNKDNGNNNVAFWFLKDKNVDCVSPSGGAVDFSGTHRDGDVLVVSAFTNGGGVSNIDAYRWDGTAGCIDNPDEPGACDSLPVASGGDCKDAGGLDSICATTNSGPKEDNDNITTQWLTADATLGVGHTTVVTDFFEGGINLTKVLGGAACYNTFLGDTRSSQSLTATLFDFARGQLGGCTSRLTTQENAASPLSIGTGSVSSGTDTATLTITGTPTWGGTLDFYLCGPSATSCDTNGALITSTAVHSTDASHAYVSGTTNLTSAGTYCWHAKFTPDADTDAAGVGAAEDNGANECFTVNPVTPTLPTSATCSASPCVVGSTLTDTATLTGAATQPGTNGPDTDWPSIGATNGAAAGGTITWVLYAPTNGGCTDTRTTTPTQRTVSGNGAYAVTYTTLSTDPVGTYTFVANYAGNGPNTNAAATVTCAAPGANETVTVTGSVSSTSQQRWLPNDRIVLTTNAPGMTGTMSATLYPTANCTGTAVTGQTYTFTLSGDPSGSVYQTTNTTFFVGTKADGTAGGSATSYSWKIHVDTNLDDPADRCESTAITITD